MANPMPCGGCSEVADAEFVVTFRAGTEWFGLTPTTPLCVSCFIKVAGYMDEAITAAQAPESEPEPEGPGVLESIEESEGPVAVTTTKPPRRSRKSKAPENNGQAVSEETQAAHVDE